MEILPEYPGPGPRQDLQLDADEAVSVYLVTKCTVNVSEWPSLAI